MSYKVLVSLLLLAAISCAPPILVRQYHRAGDYRPDDLKAKKVGILVTSKGDVSGFTKAFAKVYKDNETFAKDLREQTKMTFASSLPASKIVHLSNQQASVIFSTFNRYKTDWQTPDDKLNQVLAEVAREHDVDALLVISRWEIKQHWNTHHHAPMVGANGVMIGGGTSESKSCDVILEGGLLQVDGTPLYYGDAAGTAVVFFFNFKSTMVEAIAKAVNQYRQMIFEKTPAKNLQKF